jgi:hypothetical protein
MNLDFRFDLKTLTFTHEQSGFVFKAEDLQRYSNHELAHIFYGATGLQIDDLLLDVMREM